ncbi:hypothetical protein [Mucilaginibacter sp.]|uniref:hypothetical protein n=1 Tax=Mucilaginibacter sp. TaxID=1882438 RepID=UPI00283AD3CD|nr:hypothetical protein [Mucilaginibacter sp.]MDR3693827.1 hypothetical protein [Mucilaginibacter sp.]
MKFILIIFFASAVMLFSSCTKSPKNAGVVVPVKPVVIPDPLPNTVDKTDTINVMAYNVLKYGDGCQGSTDTLNNYLKTIIKYIRPDLFSFEKMAAFDPTPGAPFNLAEGIVNNALNLVSPGKYTYITPTNTARATNMATLFYNKQKLTFLKSETLEANITDFDLYKFYYNDPNIQITRDTTFLYVLVNHTQSGSPSTSRDIQVSTEMKDLRTKFAYLPNLVNMGDFNTHNSIEAGYQSVITSADSTTKMSDPPFYPDKAVTYPAEWENNTSLFAPFLTTTTRALATVPNSCGTGDGAKSWYDHIFISPWLVNGANYMKYIPDSYKTVGNDGNRVGVDINSVTPVVNTSAPPAVLNALFHFSDKYPITIKLLVKANRNAYSLVDPKESN